MSFLKQWPTYLNEHTQAVVLVVFLLIPTGTSAQEVRDSAGVRVVHYRRTTRPTGRWTLDSKPALDLGVRTGGGPTQFFRVYGIARLSNGDLVVANAGTDQLRFFTQSGRFIREVGGRGGGPGEFSGIIFWLFRRADTLLAVDNSGQANLFAPDGHYVRSLAYPLVQGVMLPIRAGILADGAVVIYGLDAGTSAGNGLAWYRVVSRTPGAPTKMLFRVPARQQPVRSGGARAAPMFYEPGGEVTAAGNMICAGYTAEYAITCYNASGKPAVKIERDITRQQVTRADKQFARRRYVFANQHTESHANLEREANHFRYAKQRPAFGPLILSRSGDVWVGPFQPWWHAPLSLAAPPHQVRWSVFSPQGAWLSDVLLPARFVPYEIGSDYVAGVSFDQDDAEHVTLWHMQKVARRP